MGTLFEALGITLQLVSFAFPEYAGALFTSTISPSLLSANRMGPSLHQSHVLSLTTIFVVPSANSISSCARSLVSEPYSCLSPHAPTEPLYQPSARETVISLFPFFIESVTS